MKTNFLIITLSTLITSISIFASKEKDNFNVHIINSLKQSAVQDMQKLHKVKEISEFLKSTGWVLPHHPEYIQDRLDLAIKRERVDIVQLLLERGAIVWSIHSLKATAIKNEEIRKNICDLLEKYKKSNYGKLEDISENQKISEFLKGEGKREEWTGREYPEYINDPLELAIKEERVDIVKLLLDNDYVAGMSHFCKASNIKNEDSRKKIYDMLTKRRGNDHF